MENLSKIFKTKKVIIGMIHLDALPGAPKSKNNIDLIIEKAKKEAEIYKKAGINAVEIENMHDLPYLNKNIGPEIVAIMAVVACEIKRVLLDVSCGIQILAAANKEALAVAKAAKLDFVRVEGFVFTHIADEGTTEACAGELLRYRKQIGAENILIFTDIKKKHSSHAITSDVDIIATASAAEFFLSDGVIITGPATGSEANLNEIDSIKKTIKIPVLVGSGVTFENLDLYLKAADALIVGSYFKKGGFWANELDFGKVKKFIDKANEIQKKL